MSWFGSVIQVKATSYVSQKNSARKNLGCGVLQRSGLTISMVGYKVG